MSRAKDPNVVVVSVKTTTRNKEVWRHLDLLEMSESERARCKNCGLIMGASDSSPLRKHTNETCPIVKGGVDPDQPNITPGGAVSFTK